MYFLQPARRRVNNLDDALAWGLSPLFLAAHGAGAASVGLVAGIYPGVWGVGQIWTGHWSDRVGRKPLIVAGMLVQAGALGVLAPSDGAVGVAAMPAWRLRPGARSRRRLRVVSGVGHTRVQGCV